VVACAKLATGPKAKIAVRQVAIIERFFVFICKFSFFQLNLKSPARAQPNAEAIDRAVDGQHLGLGIFIVGICQRHLAGVLTKAR
jgi:hypothetical protein